jgi:hypothetical protein
MSYESSGIEQSLKAAIESRDSYKSIAEKHLSVAKALAEAGKKVAKYHAFVPDAVAVLELDAALSLAREMLAKGAHDKGVLK